MADKLLDVNDLTVSVEEKEILHNINLSINKGETHVLMGPNGAGKSTTLNAIAGVWPVDCGQILIDGKDISALPEHKRAPYLGRVFQDPMKGTAAGMEIQENLALAYRRGKKRGLKWAIGKDEQVFYKEQLKALDLGLEDRMTSKVGLLSGGQRQALTLMMATFNPPKLLLLDEPAAGMNPNETAELMKTIRFVRDHFDMTVLLIEHDMKLVSGICERLTVLNFGHMLAEGPTSEVLSNPEVIKAYLGE